MPGRRDAYLSAELRIETPAGVVLVTPMPLMQTSGEYPDPQRRTIAVITAHNPGGQPADEEANAAAQRALEGERDRRGTSGPTRPRQEAGERAPPPGRSHSAGAGVCSVPCTPRTP